MKALSSVPRGETEERTGRQTDRHDDADNRFSKFYKRAQNRICERRVVHADSSVPLCTC